MLTEGGALFIGHNPPKIRNCAAISEIGLDTSITVTDVTDVRKKSLSFNEFQAFQQLGDNGGPGIYRSYRHNRRKTAILKAPYL